MPQMVPDENGRYGRHPWQDLYPVEDPVQKRHAHVMWLWTRGEPPRYWDEEYYINDPDPPSSLFDTVRGYRHHTEIPKPNLLPKPKGLF